MADRLLDTLQANYPEEVTLLRAALLESVEPHDCNDNADDVRCEDAHCEDGDCYPSDDVYNFFDKVEDLIDVVERITGISMTKGIYDSDLYASSRHLNSYVIELEQALKEKAHGQGTSVQPDG